VSSATGGEVRGNFFERRKGVKERLKHTTEKNRQKKKKGNTCAMQVETSRNRLSKKRLKEQDRLGRSERRGEKETCGRPRRKKKKKLRRKGL